MSIPGKPAKADLPLQRSRMRSAELVKSFVKKRPAAPVRAKPIKRTPFNLKRESTLRVGGSKLSILGPARTPKEVLKRPAATSLISKKQIGPVAKPRLCKKPAASLISKKQTRK